MSVGSIAASLTPQQGIGAIAASFTPQQGTLTEAQKRRIVGGAMVLRETIAESKLPPIGIPIGRPAIPPLRIPYET